MAVTFNKTPELCKTCKFLTRGGRACNKDPGTFSYHGGRIKDEKCPDYEISDEDRAYQNMDDDQADQSFEEGLEEND